MKRMDIFCSSQASTAICMSMDHHQASSSCSAASAIQLGGKTIDRHNPIIRDAKRFTGVTLPSNPCISQPQPPINPLPYHQLKKKKKDKKRSSISNDDHLKKKSTDSSAVNSTSTKSNNNNNNHRKKSTNSGIKDAEDRKKSFTKAIDLVTPPGSSRYLLGDSVFFDGISDYEPVWALVPSETNKMQALKQDQSIHVSKPSSSSSSSSFSEKPSTDQVVILRVSLHCRGCEGKVRKHISKMEGVTSFSIDFKAKKVTIIGDVTPLGVLASVSKVKSAQFWTSAMPDSSASQALASNNLATTK